MCSSPDQGSVSELRIAALECSTLEAVPAAPGKAVPVLWADRAQMLLDPSALGPLASWERQLHGTELPSDPGWRPEGPGRTPYEAQPLIDWLRRRAATATPFDFNALYKEKHGGRSYPYWFEGYGTPLNVSGRQYAAAKKRAPRLLLAAIHREVRALLRAPPGYTLLTGDFETCHAQLAFALTGDAALALDLGRDFHQVTGDALVPWAPAKKRRAFGKAINNCLLYGATPWRVGWYFERFFGERPGDAWAAQAHKWWWGRYPQLAAFRGYVEDLVIHCQRSNLALQVVAPSGWTSKFGSFELRRGVSKGGRPAKRPEDMWRTVFSAAFRGVEGDLLDRTLVHWHAGREAHGGRLVLPLYDGLLVAAPLGREAAVATALEAAGARAAAELGLASMRMGVTR